MSEPKLTYGIDKKGILVQIDNVPNGLACDCVCPKCGQRLEAVQGSERVHHFRHYNSMECQGAQMTALHLLAQKILQEDKNVFIPEYKGQFVQRQGTCKRYDNVVAEKKVGFEEQQLIPDCIATKVGEKFSPLWIEIYVTHPVSEEKRKIIRENNIYCIEIDCRQLIGEIINEEDLRNFLCRNEASSWINCPELDREEDACKSEWEQQELKRETEAALKAQEERLQEAERARQNDAKFRAQKEEVDTFRDLCRKWLQEGDTDTARRIKEKLPRDQFPQEETPMALRYNIYDVLTSEKGLSHFINNPLQNENTLEVFYCLLKYNYYREKDNKKDFYKELQKYHGKTLSEESEIFRYFETFSAYVITSIAEKSTSFLDRIAEDSKLLIRRFCKDKILREKCLYCFNILWKVRIVGKEENVRAVYDTVKERYPDILLPLLVAIEQNYSEKISALGDSINHWKEHNDSNHIDMDVWRILSFAFPKTYKNEILPPINREVDSLPDLFNSNTPHFGWTVSWNYEPFN